MPKELKFNGFCDFVERHEGIKTIYSSFCYPFFCSNIVREYRTYIVDMGLSQAKEWAVWSYLNNDIDNDVLYKIYDNMNQSTKNL